MEKGSPIRKPLDAMAPEEIQKLFGPSGATEEEIRQFSEAEQPLPQGGYLEMVDDVLYDHVHLSRPRTMLFCSPVGTADFDSPTRKNKDWDDTNMVIGGMLPAPNKFILEEWSCRVFRDGAPLPVFRRSLWKLWGEKERDRIYEAVHLRLLINRKIYAEAQAYDIADAQAILGNPPEGDLPELRHRFDKPIAIDTLVTFTVECQTKIVDPRFSIKVCLVGKLFRAMQ